MNAVEFVLSDPKTAATTAAVTLMTGLGHTVNLIPDDIGKVGTLVGLVLSGVLIYTQWRNGKATHDNLRAETKVHELEVKLLRQKLAEKP